MSTGAVAANFHEGSRSEYLAQYIFASLGTAVAVPHQEDSGVDLYCTLTERVGQLAWPRAHFTVQVKSADGPVEFCGANSVRWLLEHPLPWFLCVVEKKAARLRVFQTSARLIPGFMPRVPDVVRLRPGGASDSDWRDGDLALDAPISDLTVGELLDDEAAALFRAILTAWIEVDAEMIQRRRLGIESVTAPHYETNKVPIAAASSFSRVPRPGTTPELDRRLVEILEYLAGGYAMENRPSHRTTAALLAMLHRALTGGRPTDVISMMRLHAQLREATGKTGDPCEGTDHLLCMVRDAVGGSE